VVATLPPEQRHVGMVFQDYALFPHLRAWENVAFGLRGPRARRRAEARRLLRLVGLEEVAERYPHELSGGQQQRVAVARALAPRPRLLLLDEPFSNLDVDLRRRLAQDVRRLLEAQGTTALFVTHDQEEAFLMGEHVGVMRDGRLLQWDTPFNLYHEPVDRFVADFVGEGCFVRARMVDAQTVETPLGSVRGNRAYPWPPGSEVDMLVRPDDVILERGDGGGARIVDLAFRGADTLYRVRLPGGIEVQSLMPSRHEFPVGSPVRVRLEAEHLVLFPAEKGARSGC
jgi:iron(III) transport system ATP-binding protein